MIHATLSEDSHSPFGNSAKLIENMIAKECERTGKRRVECFHCTKKPRVVRDPRLGGTGWNCHADSESLFQHKPGSKSLYQIRTTMIDDRKFAICKPRGQWSALAASQRLIRPVMQYFCEHLARAEGAEQHQHGWGARFEQLSESARNRAKVHNAVQRREVRERAIEKPSVAGKMMRGKMLQLLSSCNFSSCAQRGQFGTC